MVKPRALVYYNSGPEWWVRFSTAIHRQEGLQERIEAWAAGQKIYVAVGWNQVRVTSQEDAMLLYLTFT